VNKLITSKQKYLELTSATLIFLRPKLFFPISTTVVCSGPILKLGWSLFINKETVSLKLDIILAVFCVILIVYTWSRFKKELQVFKKQKNVLNDLKKYIKEEENITDLKSNVHKELEKIIDNKN